MDRKEENLSFREGMERLEKLVNALEGDKLELEEALESYEEGIRIYRRLLSILGDAEKRIEALSGERDGKLLWEKLKGFTGEHEGEA